ncbi:hypothetical protein D915_002200 [Fasciola hepatica]|uniref:Uncharacterized protein n=1 Tax=Fasciola hepatica TaxID=6192 RepID=A0A4E0RH58_FASHE|nr:hypothetical protein D915_002200 [Fasciola hepatica]
MTLCNVPGEAREEQVHHESCSQISRPKTSCGVQQLLISSTNRNLGIEDHEISATVDLSVSNTSVEKHHGQSDPCTNYSASQAKLSTPAYNDLTTSTVTVPSVLLMDAADLNLISQTTSSSTSSVDKTGIHKTNDYRASSNLPVPSLRHRFGLNRPPFSPSPDFTHSERMFTPDMCTNESDLPLRSDAHSLLMGEDHVKRRTPEGNADLYSLGTEETLSEKTSFLSPVPTITVPNLSDECQTTVHQNDGQSLAPKSSSIPCFTSNSPYENLENTSRMEPTQTAAPNLSPKTKEGAGNSTVPKSRTDKEETQTSPGNVSVSMVGAPLLNEACQCDSPVTNLGRPTTQEDDSVLKWDYAGDLASQKLSVDLGHQKLTFEEIDHVSDEKESMEADIFTVPFTWPSPLMLYSSTHIHANWMGRKMRSRHRYGVRDRPHVHGLSTRFTKGSSANALSHGSFICSPDPEEIEDGALTVPVGKLMSESGNIYSLRSESSLIPMMMGDGLDELESDEEPLSRENAPPDAPISVAEDVQQQQQREQKIRNTEGSPDVTLDPNQCKPRIPLSDRRRSSLDEIDQVCLSASQTMLRLRRHADRVLEATETAERSLRERLDLLSVAVTDRKDGPQKPEAKNEIVYVPEPRVRLSYLQNDPGCPTDEQEKHDSLSRCLLRPSNLATVQADEPISSEVVPNSSSWTSGSEDLVLNRPKSHRTPSDLPPLQFDLSSGVDDETLSTSSARSHSRNTTPTAIPGATQRTASPPFTEPNVLSAMTTVTPLAHTPRLTHLGAGEPEWDSKRSSLVEEPRSILGGQSYVSDNFYGPVALRQGQSGLSSPASAYWNPIINQAPKSSLAVKGHGDILCDHSAGIDIERRTTSMEMLKFSQLEIQTDQDGFAWHPGSHYTRSSHFSSVGEIHLLDQRDLDRSEAHFKNDQRGSTLSLPVGEIEVRQNLSFGPSGCLSPSLSDADGDSSQSAIDRHQSVSKKVPNTGSVRDCISPVCYRVQPHATSAHSTINFNQPMASSTRVNSADATVTSDSLNLKERLTTDSLVSRPPRSEGNIHAKMRSANKNAHGYLADSKDVCRVGSNKSPRSSDKYSGISYTVKRSASQITAQDDRNHSYQDNDGMSFRSDAHSAGLSCARDHLSTSRLPFSNSISLFASQLRYMLLKHRLKLARAKDAYLLRRRVVEQLELLLHKVCSKQKDTIQQGMPVEWDTDTSSLVTDIGDESVQDHSINYYHKEDIVRRPMQHKDRNRDRLSASRSKVTELVTSKISPNPCNKGENSNVIEESTSPIVPKFHGSFLRMNHTHDSVSCQTKAQMTSSKLINDQNNRHSEQEKPERDFNHSLCELRDRAEKQLAEMVHTVKRNMRARSDSPQDPVSAPDPGLMSTTSRIMAWAEERSHAGSSHSRRRSLSGRKSDKAGLASDARASHGGVTWFQTFSPVPMVRESVPVRQSMVRVVRESPRAFSRDRLNGSSNGDTYLVEAVQSVVTKTAPDLNRSAPGNMVDHALASLNSTSRASVVGGTGQSYGDMTDIRAGENKRHLYGELMLPERDSGNEVPPVNMKLGPAQISDSTASTSENEERTEPFCSGIVATPRGVAFSIHGDQDRHSSRTYRVTSIRSNRSEHGPFSDVLDEEQKLSVDLQTLFRQRMAHWISRSRERQKRIQLAAFERRYSKAMQTERAILFRALRPDYTGAVRSTTCDAISSSNRRSKESHQDGTWRTEQSFVATGIGSLRERQSGKKTDCGSQSDRCKSQARVPLNRVRPQLPGDHQRRALESKLTQLRTNRLRMKIYGEKVLRSVLQRRAPWSVSFKEI